MHIYTTARGRSTASLYNTARLGIIRDAIIVTLLAALCIAIVVAAILAIRVAITVAEPEYVHGIAALYHLV